MLLTLTAKRQVTFPAQVLASLGAQPGDKIELLASPQGYLLRPRTIAHNKLGSLRSKIQNNASDFDIHAFRATRHDPALRD
jgi:bifunctional DNA-binding transcriptional regulator/antitoxin component of YhaV-PrlF toxin-antitoxin module